MLRCMVCHVTCNGFYVHHTFLSVWSFTAEISLKPTQEFFLKSSKPTLFLTSQPSKLPLERYRYGDLRHGTEKRLMELPIDNTTESVVDRRYFLYGEITVFVNFVLRISPVF